MAVPISNWADLADHAPAGALFFHYRRPTEARTVWREGDKRFNLHPDDADPEPIEGSGSWIVEFFESAAKSCKPIPFDNPAKQGVRASKTAAHTELAVAFLPGSKGLARRGASDSHIAHLNANVFSLCTQMIDRVNSGNDALVSELTYLRQERRELIEKVESLTPGFWTNLLERFGPEIIDGIRVLKDGGVELVKVMRGVQPAQIEALRETQEATRRLLDEVKEMRATMQKTQAASTAAGSPPKRRKRTNGKPEAT